MDIISDDELKELTNEELIMITEELENIDRLLEQMENIGDINE